MKKLYIAEKPSVGRVIAASLGIVTPATQEKSYIECANDVWVAWSVGHILELVTIETYLGLPEKTYWSKSLDKLPYFPQTYIYEVKSDKRSLFNNLKSLIKKADVIVNAADADAEGQLLIDEILVHCGVNPDAEYIKRILPNSLEATALQKAMGTEQPNARFRGLRLSAMARGQADFIVGINSTRAFTLANTSGKLMNVGRVKSPTLALVVNREREINAFKPVDYFIPTMVLQDGTELAWKGGNAKTDEHGRIVDKNEADAVAERIKRAGYAAVVTDAKSVEKSVAPPPPYKLSTLQNDMSKRHGISVDKTSEMVQAMYQNKFVTYPRSDCEYLTKSMLAETEKVLSAVRQGGMQREVENADTSIVTKAWNDAKVDASSHHAIIPTGNSPAGLSNDERNVYQAIARRYLAQFYPNSTHRADSLEIESSGEKFAATRIAPLTLGWKSLFSAMEGEDEITDKDELILTRDLS